MTSMLRKVVKSPYWPENRFVNPNFPHGCSRVLGAALHKQEVVLRNRKSPKVITLSSERNALKQAKKACVNKGKLTTIVRTSLDPKHVLV